MTRGSGDVVAGKAPGKVPGLRNIGEVVGGTGVACAQAGLSLAAQQPSAATVAIAAAGKTRSE